MNFQLLAAVMFLGTASSAIAGDKVVDEAVMVESLHDWSGAYVGGYAGYGAGSGARSSSDLDDNNFSPSGVAVGGIAGWNWQNNAIVFGLEADAGYGGFSNDFVAWHPGGNFNNGFEFDGGLLVTVRGRVGVSTDNALLYVTGGFAGLAARLEDVPGNGEDFQFMTGWVAGGGIEWAATETVSLRIEGLYMDFGDKEFDAGSIPDTVDLDVGAVRAAALFHF